MGEKHKQKLFPAGHVGFCPLGQVFPGYDEARKRARPQLHPIMMRLPNW